MGNIVLILLLILGTILVSPIIFLIIIFLFDLIVSVINSDNFMDF